MVHIHGVYACCSEGYVLAVFQSISNMVSDHFAVCKSDTSVYATFCSKGFPNQVRRKACQVLVQRHDLLYRVSLIPPLQEGNSAYFETGMYRLGLYLKTKKKILQNLQPRKNNGAKNLDLKIKHF